MKKLSTYAGEKNHLLVEYITKKGLWKSGLKHPNKNRWAPIKIDGEVVIVVELTRGYVMIVDPVREEEELLRDRCYYALISRGEVRAHSKDGYFHRHLMQRLRGEIREDQEVDHRDRRTLNNTRANLRLVSSSENGRNRGLRRDSSSGHKGISWCNRDQVWLVECKVNGKRRRRSINPRKLGMSREEALEVAIEWRKKFEEEMGYHAF